jgi:hypothetical protein
MFDTASIPIMTFNKTFMKRRLGQAYATVNFSRNKEQAKLLRVESKKRKKLFLV